MKYKTQLECMDQECRTVMFGHFIEEINCVKCGGPAIEKPYSPVEKQVNQNKNSELTIQVSVDTTEALEGIKEVTEAANECAGALDKLEKIMDKFTNRSDTVEIYCEGKLLSKPIVNHAADSIQGHVIKGEALGGSEC
ncbi:hypothetical protein ACQKF0_12610 [Bacillus wiedmannii]|uniref:hypothetical protein n=1 Tax=Bacillus wiedmannii TaxID=1890302 RepID=UPI003D04DBDD